jgi:hypothetical protein
MMNTGLLRSTRKTEDHSAGETRESLPSAVSPDTVFALLRWENEGGSPLRSAGLDLMSRPLSGSPSQIEWAKAIRTRVNDEFDRVAASFRSIAYRQTAGKRSDTEAILAILEDKRIEILSQERAGYFIHDWQEINDQVRQMIGKDLRYQAMKAEKAAGSSLNGDI